MGIKYQWDTNTAIYFLQQQFPLQAEIYMDNIVSNYQPAISAITEIELLCWKAPTIKDEEILRNFISDARVIELDSVIKLRTSEIRKSIKIKLPDAIIAATALIHNLTLISRNVADFKKVPELKLVNPWDISNLPETI